MSDTNLTSFDPTVIDWQYHTLKKIRKDIDYSSGVQQILLSGSVGSAKSLLMTHIICTHALFNPGACIGIGRLAMPRLRETLLRGILDHLEGVVPHKHNRTTGIIEFENGSRIIPFSWADKQYKKVRSFEFSLFAIEELTETDNSEMYQEIIMRMRQNSKERLVISATNPDEPD